MYYARDGTPITLDQWIGRRDDGLRVAFTEVDDGFVSTVWLGLDHGFGDGPPLIFETMIQRRGVWLDYQERYSTEADARRGHEFALKWLAAGMPDLVYYSDTPDQDDDQ